jgi:hypothetical protein
VEHFLSSCGEEWDLEKLSLSDYGPTFFDDFLRNVWDSGLQNRILPFRATSSSALPFFDKQGLRFDVIYVDGAHDTYSVFTDGVGALKITSENGLVCGDDFYWSSVRHGLRLLALTHRKPLHFYVKGSDFVILKGSHDPYGPELAQLGYRRWRALDVREGPQLVASWCRRRLSKGDRPLPSAAHSSGG